MKIARFNDGPEIFYSIQGEGHTVGRPSVFLRTSMCNLHCFWCDTDYTWNWEGTVFRHVNDADPGFRKYKKSEQIVELDVEEVGRQILRYQCPNVILTGGEPLLHRNDLVQLIDFLRTANPDFRFEVETNGTLNPGEELHQRIDQFNVSPKLSNSGDPKRYREKPEVLHYFAQHPKAWFKFVMKDATDLSEVLALQIRYKIRPECIYLMPEGRTATELSAGRDWVIDLCKQHGYRFSDRLHIHLWGSKRGI